MVKGNYMIRALILFVLCHYTFIVKGQKSLLMLTPDSGTPGQLLDVIVQCSDPVFKAGISTIDFGSGIGLLKPLLVTGDYSATASIRIDANAILGKRNVTLKNGSEVSAESLNGFEVFTAGGINNFRATMEMLPFETYSLSDFDVTNPSKQPIIFFVNLFNDQLTRNIKISIQLTTGKWGPVGNIIIDKKILAANQFLRLSNRDFEKFDVMGLNGAQFLTSLKELGTLPPDEYSYQLTVTENGTTIGGDDQKVIVTNPVYNPELIAPGALFSANPEPVYSEYPLFQWFGQASSFDYALYMVRNGQTPEEVVRSLPLISICACSQESGLECSLVPFDNGTSPQKAQCAGVHEHFWGLA